MDGWAFRGSDATLRAQEHGHPPCVLAAGFVRSVPLRAGVSATGGTALLPSGRSIPTAVYENHSQDTRYTALDTAPRSAPPTAPGKQPALRGAGGHAQDAEDSLRLRGRCKGPLIKRTLSATLSCNNDQTLFVPKWYALCGFQCRDAIGQSHSGIYERTPPGRWTRAAVIRLQPRRHRCGGGADLRHDSLHLYAD